MDLVAQAGGAMPAVVAGKKADWHLFSLLARLVVEHTVWAAPSYLHRTPPDLPAPLLPMESAQSGRSQPYN